MLVVRFAEEALDSCDLAKSVGRDPMTRIPLLLDYHRPIFIGVFALSHMLICNSPNVRLNRDHLISLKQSMADNYARAFDEDPVDRSP